MKTQTLKFFTAAILLVVLDLPWLMVSGPYVKDMVQRIQGSPLKLSLLPAAVVYAAMAYLLLQTKTPLEAFYIGAATYAVYDFTNLATLKNYDLSFALVDSLWGGILFAMARFLLNRF
jgi:uncharacterized membrane protein